MKLTAYTFSTLLCLANCAVQQIPTTITNNESVAPSHKNQLDSITQPDNHLDILNDSKIPDLNNLTAFDYIEKFNNTSIQDQLDIKKYLAGQNQIQDLDDTLDENFLAKESTPTQTIDPQLEEEFRTQYEKNEGRWDALRELAPEQQLELCKDAHRREHDVKVLIFYESKFIPELMKVTVEKIGHVTPDLLECTLNWSTKWNNLVFPQRSTFYLAEGSSPAKVFKLLAVSKDEVKLVGNIDQLKYPK